MPERLEEVRSQCSVWLQPGNVVEARVVPPWRVQFRSLRHGKRCHLDRATVELVALRCGCNVFEHQTEGMRGGINVGVQRARCAYSNRRQDRVVEHHFLEVVVLRNASRPTGGVLRSKLANNGCGTGASLVFEREAYVATNLPSADLAGCETGDLHIHAAVLQHRCQPACINIFWLGDNAGKLRQTRVCQARVHQERPLDNLKACALAC